MEREATTRGEAFCGLPHTAESLSTPSVKQEQPDCDDTCLGSSRRFPKLKRRHSA